MSMKAGARLEVITFVYPAEGDAAEVEWEGVAEAGYADGREGEPGEDQAEPALVAGKSQVAAEELGRSFEHGRAIGMQEGRLAEHEAQAEGRASLERETAGQMARAVERFDAERERYFHAVEQEVVRLALAIAARILRREAQMDPLLLTGAARVALGQLSESTQVRLKVPGAYYGLWKEAMEHLPNLAVRPEVIASEEMRLGDCVLETELGTVDLGVRAQLSEIEHGFFDRAAHVHEPMQAGTGAYVVTGDAG